MFALEWYRACARPTVAHPLTLLRFRVSEMVGGERFGLCCLPDPVSTSYSREHSQLGNHKSMSPVLGVRLFSFSRFPLLSSLLSGEHWMEGRRKHLSSLQNLPTIPRPFHQVYSKEGDWAAFFFKNQSSPLCFLVHKYEIWTWGEVGGGVNKDVGKVLMAEKENGKLWFIFQHFLSWELHGCRCDCALL